MNDVISNTMILDNTKEYMIHVHLNFDTECQIEDAEVLENLQPL
jgi:hypothetical protein